MTRRLRWFLLAGVLAPLLLAPPAAALSRELPLDEVFARGEAVFVGTVVSTRAVWGEGRKMIWTEYVFDVRETWKGEGRARRTLRVAGGRLDGRTVVLSHVPSFEVGGTYVVSAYANEHLYASPVVGTEQGAFREAVEETTGSALLVDTEGLRLERDPSGRLRRGRPSVPGSRPGLVRLLSDGSIALRAGAGGPRKMGEPVYRDGTGKVVSKASARIARPQGAARVPVDGTAVTTRELRDHVTRLVSAAER